MKISILYLGYLEMLKKHLVACDNDIETIQCHVPAILIQHPTLGNILYDTGNSPFSNVDYSKVISDNFPVKKYISIEDALAQKGLKPKDIDLLILSHLHFDHAGGLKYFKGTNAIKHVVIAEKDLKNAFFKVMTGEEKAYCKSLTEVEDLGFETINDTTKLAEDLTLFIQQCHTPGVIGLILKTKNNGTIIATSDTIYTRESFEKNIPPGGHNSDSALDFHLNLQRIKEMQNEHNATLFFGHDESQIEEWVKKDWID